MIDDHCIDVLQRRYRLPLKLRKRAKCVPVQSTRRSTFSLLKSLTHQRKSWISPALRSTLSVPRPFNLCHCDLQLYSTGLKATQGWLIARSTGWRVLLIDLTTGKSLKFWLGFERFKNSESCFGLFLMRSGEQKKDGEDRRLQGQTSYRECARRTRRPRSVGKKFATVAVTSNIRTHV